MPTNHGVVAALPISSAADQTLLRNVLVVRMAYVLADTDDPQQLVEIDPTTGATIIDIFYLGRVFHLDATDKTTVHDGTTCLVAYGNNRYKLASGSDIVAYAVLTRTNTPPGSPVIGAAYLVTTAPTGAWAGKVNNVAIFTARGWEFLVFAIGRFIYVEDVDIYYHKDAAGDWIAGFGNQSVGAGIILPSNLKGGGGKLRWIVENQTTNDPPGSVTEGAAYIVGPSPTGAWAGQATKIAHGESGVWVIYTPGTGWRCYDKDAATSSDFLYSGSGWVSATGNFKIVTISYSGSGAFTWTKPARLIGIEVPLVGSGGAAAAGAATSFGSHLSATGGAKSGNGGGDGVGGVGSNGDENYTGESGAINQISTSPGAPFGNKGRGSGGTPTDVCGGAGGSSRKYIQATALGATETVTLNVGGVGANNGYVSVKQYIEI